MEQFLFRLMIGEHIPMFLGNKKAEVFFLCLPSTLVVFVVQPKKAHHHAGGLNQ